MGFGLYALVFPAFGVLLLTDSDHMPDPVSTGIGVTAVVTVAAAIGVAAFALTVT